MLEPGGYVGMYQQQKGLGILYEILFALFGNFNYTPAKILHVIWWVLAILAGYGFLKLNTDRTSNSGPKEWESDRQEIFPTEYGIFFPLMFPHFYLIVPHNFCHRHILPAFHSHIPVSVLPLPEIAVQRLHAFLSVRRKRSAFPWATSVDTISYW